MLKVNVCYTPRKEVMSMPEKQCGSCKYFQQHYTLSKGRLIRVYCGRCLFGRPKKRFYDSAACETFVIGSSDVEAFADTQYLTKELLNYVLALPLLPEIENESPS